MLYIPHPRNENLDGWAAMVVACAVISECTAVLVGAIVSTPMAYRKQEAIYFLAILLACVNMSGQITKSTRPTEITIFGQLLLGDDGHGRRHLVVLSVIRLLT